MRQPVCVRGRALLGFVTDNREGASVARDMKLGWDVEALNKAYRQGYLAGSMGMGKDRCPYPG